MPNHKNYKIYNFLINHLKPLRKNVIIFAFQVLISASLMPIDGFLVKYFIDYISTHEITPNVAFISTSLFFLWWNIWNIFYRLYEYSLMKILPAIRANVIHSLIDYAGGHSYKFYQENFSGSISNKISDASKNLANAFSSISKIAHKILMMIFSIIILYQASWHFSVIITFYVIAFISINIYFLKPIENYSKIFAERRSINFGKIVDFITNMNNVRYFSSKEHEIKYLNTYIQDAKDKDIELKKYNIKINYFKSLVNNTLCAFIIYYTVTLYATGKLSYGDFYLIFMIWMTITNEVWDFLENLADFTEEIGSCRQAIETIYIPHEIKDSPNAKNLEIKHAAIEIKNINFKYLKDNLLFENLSLTIQGGTKVGLVGYSGSGKSSFVNLLVRLFEVNNGEILIDGQNIEEITQESLRKNISFIPQDPILFHRSLKENIKYGRLDATDEEVFKAAKQAHAHEFILQTEQGYDSLVGERGIKLSGGQRQRIAIARAILKNAPILILDEATSSLDTLTEKIIQESLYNLMKNRTTICIAHRLSTLLKMDRIIVFNKGKIVEDGTHEELINKNGLYNKMWASQINGFIIDDKNEDEQNII